MNKDGKLILGFSKEEYENIKKYCNEKNYDILERMEISSYITTSAYVEEDGSIWVSYDIFWKINKQEFPYYDLIGSTILIHLKQKKEKWEIIESIGPEEIKEFTIEYKKAAINVDRIIRVSNNKIYLWGRKFIDQTYDEKLEEYLYTYDREIWVLEKK